MMTVPLHGAKAAGRVALVDDADFETVSGYRWTVWEPPGGGGPYAITNLGGGRKVTRAKLMHQMLTGYALTDHRDGDGLNNQRSNLRPATHGQNRANQRPRRDGLSRYKGVGLHRANGKWRARIKVNGRSISLGLYVLEEDAARAYDAAARELFGEFARLNFPQQGHIS